MLKYVFQEEFTQSLWSHPPQYVKFAESTGTNQRLRSATGTFSVDFISNGLAIYYEFHIQCFQYPADPNF